MTVGPVIKNNPPITTATEIGKSKILCNAIAPSTHDIAAPTVIIRMTALEMPLNSRKSKLLLPSNKMTATLKIQSD